MIGQFKSIWSSPEHTNFGGLFTVEAFKSLGHWFSIQGYTKGLGLACQLSFSFACHLLWLNSTSFLHLLFTLSVLAPGSQNYISFVKECHKIWPLVCLLDFCLKFSLCLFIHAFLNVIEEFRNHFGKLVPLNFHFFSIIPKDTDSLFVVNILGANLHSNGHTLKFPIVVLPAGRINVSVINVSSDTRFL